MPLRLEVKTKAERGYALLEGGGLQIEKAAEIDIPPKMPAEEAFRAIARSCLRQTHRQRADDVAPAAPRGCIRCASACGVCAPPSPSLPMSSATRIEKTIKSELKWITQELGPARDLDVFAADVLDPLRASHPSDAGLSLDAA